MSVKQFFPLVRVTTTGRYIVSIQDRQVNPSMHENRRNRIITVQLAKLSVEQFLVVFTADALVITTNRTYTKQ